MKKKIEVGFINERLIKSLNNLREGAFKDKQLFDFLNRAINDLKKNPFCGIKIPKKLWPKDYKKYNLFNLWKYNLPNAWRLIYTIKQDEVSILSIILEWFNHKEYNKRFHYN